MLPVFITDTASRELEKIASEMDSLRASIRFQTEARLACERLGLMPTIGSLLTELESTDAENIRCYTIKKFRNYIILYRILNHEVHVLHIIDGRRDYLELFAGL